jgi:dienelactone hydrolase
MEFNGKIFRNRHCVMSESNPSQKRRNKMKNRWRFSLSVVLIFGVIGPVLSGFEKPPEKKRPIEIADILAWKSLGSSALSPDGNWYAYGVSSRQGFAELVIRRTKEDKDFRFPLNVSGIAFSDDSRWVAFFIRLGRKEEEKMRKEKKRIEYDVGLVDLTGGDKHEFEKIQRFAFPEERSDWIALHAYPPELKENKDKGPKGSTLILHELATGQEISIGNVSEFDFNKKGRWLAWTIDAWGKSGNGIQVRDMETGRVFSLDSDKADYSQLTWTKNGEGLSALKAVDDENTIEKRHFLVAFRNFKKGSPERVVYPGPDESDFPEGMTVSPHRRPEWTDDLTGLIFGIHEVKEKPEKKEEEQELPDLVLWHWLDDRLQSQQQVEEKKDKEFSYLCVYWVSEDKCVRLADNELKEVETAHKQQWALGMDSRETMYGTSLDGKSFLDFYVIDMKTGSRTLALKKYRKFTRPRWTHSLSPLGDRFLYYQDGHFFTYEMETGQKINITEKVPTSFVNTENTYNQVDPPIEPVGWSSDGDFVLLYDNWDVWKVPVEGGESLNLTENGKEEGIRYQRRYSLERDEEGIDLSQPLYFQAYGEWTKKSGIAKIDPGESGVKMFFWDDAVYYYLEKAKKSDTFLYTRQTYDSYDTYITDSSFKPGRPMTNICAQQEEFLWSSGRMLLDYTSTKGEKLQTALFLPADYEKGKRYPTVAYIYEKHSDWLNRYLGPGLGGLSFALYSSHGYALLLPDIVNHVDDPALSALWCVLPAVEAGITAGVVDPERVGLHGHSMGGWETAFLITQTDLFKAAVAGAPLTDLISMYGSIYEATGGFNGALFESSQGRIRKNYCEDMEPFIRNSPIFHADKVNTPLMILHNDKDRAVDFNQGIEYFNILRRLKKPVFLLQYKGEGHSVRKFENRLDYSVRMKEFFDHYLKGEPAPYWQREGIPHLQMKDHLKQRAKELEGTNKEKKEE